MLIRARLGNDYNVWLWLSGQPTEQVMKCYYGDGNAQARSGAVRTVVIDGFSCGLLWT